MKGRLLVIGLDGYDPAFADTLMDAGELPNLRMLKESSATVMLDHGHARRTGLAWEHFSTGLAPREADRYSAVDFDPKRYLCTQRGTALAPFTALLDQPTVVFDAPYFDLRKAGRTQGVVGWGAHDPGVDLHSRPYGLSAELAARFGPYPAKRWIYGHTWPSANQTRESGRSLAAAVATRAAAAKWLLNERIPDWKLGILVVSELHSAVEALYHGIDAAHPLAGMPSALPACEAMHQVYAATDDLVGQIVASHPDATTLVFSMHGMGPNESDVTSMALLPELLYRWQSGESLLGAAESALDCPQGLVIPPEKEAWTTSVRRCVTRQTNARAELAAETPQRAPGALSIRARQALRRTVRRWISHRPVRSTLDWMPAAWYAPHWPHMNAFALPSFYDGQIRINLQGREAEGRVPIETYSKMLEQIQDVLHACTDPATGRGIVRDLIRTERADPLDLGPTEADLIVVWKGAPAAIQHPELGCMGPLPYRRPGGHTGGHGIAMLCGEEIAAGSYGVRSAFDVAATIMQMVNGRQSPAMSGLSFFDTVRIPGR